MTNAVETERLNYAAGRGDKAFRIANLSMHLYGMHGNTRNRASMGYMQAVSSTIAGGTSEVQKGIIATRGLGLPRG